MYNNVEIKNLTRRVESVLEYIRNNPESDPNCYEMMELTILVANECANVRKYGIEKNKDGVNGYRYVFNHIELQDLKEKYLQMMDIRLKDLKDLVGALDPLYQMLKDKVNIIEYYMDFNYKEEKARFMCKLVGVSLYIRQRIRDLSNQNNYTEIIYDNEEEFSYLKHYYNLLMARGDKEIENINRVLNTISKYFNKTTQQI